MRGRGIVVHLHCRLICFRGQNCNYRRQWAQRLGTIMCISPRKCPAGEPHICLSLIWTKTGDMPSPLVLCSLGKKGVASRKVEKESFCSRSRYRWACRQSTSQWAGRLHLGAVSLKHLNWWEAGSWSASLLPLLWDMCVSSARANHQACPQSAAQSCFCNLVIAKKNQEIDRSWKLSK